MKKILITIVFIVSIADVNALETEGPQYVRNAFVQSGVFNPPAYEFTSAYDTYNTSTANSTIKGLFIEGLPYSFAKNGNAKTKVFCWYGVPKGLVAGEKRPAVVLLHGGGGDAFTAWVDKWTNNGYIAIAIALEGQVPDKNPNWTYSGPARNGFFGDIGNVLQDQWFYHAVGDAILANSLLRNSAFTNQVDTSRIGVTGISWGGIITNVVTGIDNRFNFSIPVYGCAYLYNSPIYSNMLAGLSSPNQNLYMKNWEPSLYLPLQKSPTLFIDGTNDLQFTMNIFTKTYNASPNEKYLRIEKNMVHGHAPGWSPLEIYNFANYITGYNTSTNKPLTFTSESITDSKNINYQYSFKGQVDQAILYYTTDTVKWGQTEYEWLSKTCTLTKEINSGTVTATVPNDAQAYFVNITSGTLIYSSTMKYLLRDYNWYNNATSEFITPITNTSGGTVSESTPNPNTSGINPSANVSKFVKQSGTQAKIGFNINQPIKDISYLKQKLRLLFSGDLASMPDKSIRIKFLNSGLGSIFSLSLDKTIVESGTWNEYEFDFSGITMPAEVIAAGGYDKMYIEFAIGDLTTNSAVYYFDDIRSTLKQTIIKLIPYYNWFDFSSDPKVENISYVSVLGGTYSKLYNFTNDAGVSADVISKTGIASKFTKIAGSNRYTQLRYNFKEGMMNESSITFKLRALFKPKTISEINILDNTSRMVRLYLRDEIGTTLSPQIASTYAYFSLINAWQDLEFTFTSDALKNYDRLVVMVTPNYTNPINDNGVSLDEELNYYFGSLKATVSLENLSSDIYDKVVTTHSLIYPNPVADTFRLTSKCELKRIYNMYGQLVKQFFEPNEQYNVPELNKGIYFTELNFEDGSRHIVQFIKK